MNSYGHYVASYAAIPVCIDFARALRHHIAPLLAASRPTLVPGSDAPSRSRRRGVSGVGCSASAGEPSGRVAPPPPPGAQARSADLDSTPTEDSEYSSPDASDDEDHGRHGTPAPLPLPHGFSIAESGFLTDEHFEIRAHNPAAAALVNRYILYRWAGFGWCVGQITSRHTCHLERHKTPKGYANFVVHYESDGSTGQHTLCFDSYNDDETATSPVSTWVLLDKI